MMRFSISFLYYISVSKLQFLLLVLLLPPLKQTVTSHRLEIASIANHSFKPHLSNKLLLVLELNSDEGWVIFKEEFHLSK